MYMIIKVKNITASITPSNRKNKKLKAVFKYKGETHTLHFGDKRYEQYKDKSKFYSHLDHLDEKRRRNYRQRHSNIMSNGSPAYLNPTSPAFWSYNILW